MIDKIWTIAVTDYRIFTARLLAFLNAISYTLMSLSVKKASHIGGLDLVCVRGLFTFLISYYFLNRYNKDPWPSLPFDKNTIIIRATVGGLGLVTIYLSLKITDL